MKKIYKYTVFLFLSAVLIGCAGKTANPVQQYQIDDKNMSCSRIEQELIENQGKILHLVPKQDKAGKNVGLGVAGAFFIVPLFFMDFSDAERIEVESYQRRDQRLRILADKKGCDEDGFPKPIKFAAK